jgi:hypothetical protein
MAPPLAPVSLQCPQPELRPGAQGLARVAVDDRNATLVVTFLRPIALPAQAYLLDPRSYTLTGGQRRFPRVLTATPLTATPPDPTRPQVRLTLDILGDFSVYTLTVSGPDIDPFFASGRLRFRLACGDPFDCRERPAAAAPAPGLPVVIDYLAKDYASFRQALLDFVPTRLPAWTERSEADLGMMLLELLAATGDTLSYVQDRIANEAFLETATQRRSVAGHLALLGYEMDDGASAWTWLQFQVNELHTVPAAGFQVGNAPTRPGEPVIVFETLAAATLDPRHNTIALYAWGHADCCLPRQATSAVLAGRYDGLKAGDHLLLADDQGHRDVVRLIADAEVVAVPAGAPPPAPGEDRLTVVRWSVATPLQHDYCLGAAPDQPARARTLARANLVPSTHGETIRETLRAAVTTAPPGPSPRRQRLRLGVAPLARLDAETLRAVVPLPTGPEPTTPFTERAAGGASTLQLDVDGQRWQERQSLLGSRPDDPVFRVELDDEGAATVVFGDDVFGQRLPDTAEVTALYRVGGGTLGNVAADTLTRAVEDPLPWLVSVTNPLAAVGGRDPESREHARRTGPATFQTPLVAVTAADYQAAAQAFVDPRGEGRIQRATAAFRWTGSWLTVQLAVDPLGGERLSPALGRGLRDHLEAARLTGYDLAVAGAVYVPIDLALEFCAAPGARASDVQLALQQALGAFFHPDNFSFGDALHVSRFLAAVMAVPGVESARVTRLARLHAALPERDTATNLRQGFLAIGAREIVRLDNDRNFPEHGLLAIQPRGEGR